MSGGELERRILEEVRNIATQIDGVNTEGDIGHYQKPFSELLDKARKEFPIWWRCEDQVYDEPEATRWFLKWFGDPK